MKLKPVVLAVISGVLLFLSFPNFIDKVFPGWPPYLAWIALMPLFFALNKRTFLQSLLLGLITGFVFFAGLLYWIIYIRELGLLAYPLWLGFSLYLALYVAVFSGLLRFAPLSAAPFLWVVLEYLRSIAFSGFPWGIIGYSQYDMTTLIQISSYTGVYGVSFLIVMVNAVVVSLFINLKDETRAFMAPLTALAAFIAVFIYGIVAVDSFDQRVMLKNAPMNLFSRPERMSVAVLQGNVPQDVKWDEKFTGENFNIYEQLTLSVKEPTDLFVWPESASTVLLRYQPKYMRQVSALARSTRSAHVIGTPDATLTKDGSIDKAYVSAFHISRAGELESVYNKMHLVPFGESVPLKGLLKGFEKYTAGFSDYSPGSDKKVFSSKKNFSVLICYEAIFPEISRDFANKGAEFLVNITNDAWYWDSAMPYQHFSMLPFRAVETRLEVARAANTGVSGFVDQCGRITEVSTLFKKAALRRELTTLKSEPTFYRRYGDVFVYACILLGLFSFFRGRRVI